jgi:hypothetical protein
MKEKAGFMPAFFMRGCEARRVSRPCHTVSARAKSVFRTIHSERVSAAAGSESVRPVSPIESRIFGAVSPQFAATVDNEDEAAALTIRCSFSSRTCHNTSAIALSVAFPCITKFFAPC